MRNFLKNFGFRVLMGICFLFLLTMLIVLVGFMVYALFEISPLFLFAMGAALILIIIWAAITAWQESR